VLPSEITTDLNLLRRIATRDESAIGELYDRHSRLVFGVITRILRSPSDAEEVLQETFVRVWARADTYDSRLGSPIAWLIRIARNRSIDRLRARRARADVDAVATPSLTKNGRLHEQNTVETPERLLQGAATAVTVRCALATLPDAQRTLIEAAFFEGDTHHELAVRFGVPLGTVKTRIRSGLMTLRGRLEHAL
jgi:RNA polymerase sigma-70 factor (ECF subfamily)